jgi:hypothetical protein
MVWLDGEHLDPANMLRWDVIGLNLRGIPAYRHSKPWVYKKRVENGRIAMGVLMHIEDDRPTGPSEGRVMTGSMELCIHVKSLWSSVCPSEMPPSFHDGRIVGWKCDSHRR